MPLTACDTLFGAKGVQHYPARTAAIEHRRDEEVFTTQYEILFDSGMEISTESADTISYLADIIKKSHPTQVSITGHTDSFGDQAFNKKLSLKRARSVAQKLKTEGVNIDGFIITGAGEDDAAVPTTDGVKLLDNRRVVVELKK
jgi:outer membrane protein OmpA-like peptidoglycan-associated protein